MAISPMTNDIVDFQLVVNGINGDERKDCTVIVPDMTFQAARLMDQEIAVKHSQLFNYFKDKVGGVDNPAAYKYFAIQWPNDKVEVIGLPWVNESTYKTVQGRIKSFTVTNWQENMNGPLSKALRDLGARYTSHESTT